MLGSGDTGDGVFSKGKSALSSSRQTKLDAYIKPWVDLYTGKDATFGAEAKTTVHLIGGLCSSNCGNGRAHRSRGHRSCWGSARPSEDGSPDYAASGHQKSVQAEPK